MSRAHPSLRSIARNLPLLVAALSLGACEARGDPATLQRLWASEVEAAALAGTARRAMAGDADAFDEMQASIAAIDQQLADAPTDPKAAAAIDAARRAWRGVREPVDQLQSGRAVVLDAHEALSEIDASAVRLQSLLHEATRQAADAAAKGGSGCTDAAGTMRWTGMLVTLVPRISSGLREVVGGGAAAVSAQDRVRRDLTMTQRLLDGLRRGDAESGIAKAAPATAALLDEAAAVLDALKPRIEAIDANAAALLELADAAGDLHLDVADLRATLQAQRAALAR